MEDYKFIPELYNMLKKGSSDEEIANYIATKGIRLGKDMIAATFKRAGKKDNITEMLKEYEVSIGDTIQSRMTNRIGTVYGVHSDGRTLEVKWAEGGRQLISKEAAFKLKNKKVDGKLANDATPYGDVDKLKKNNGTEVDEQEVPEFKVLSPEKSETYLQQPKDKEVKAV
jgi:hypothetical protein